MLGIELTQKNSNLPAFVHAVPTRPVSPSRLAGARCDRSPRGRTASPHAREQGCFLGQSTGFDPGHRKF